MNKSKTDSELFSAILSIPGIGRTKAEQLISAGVTSINDLSEKKYNDMLSSEAKIHVKYLPNITFIERNAATALFKYFPQGLIPVGSYKRGVAKSYDLDFLSLIPIAEIKVLFTLLGEYTKKYKIVDSYNEGEKRIKLMLQLNNKEKAIIKIDLFYVASMKELPFAIFHYTGNKIFNIKTRMAAKKMGYLLNQYGLFKNGEYYDINAKTERDIFTYLAIPYKDPRNRSA